jgi:hypothetical protein
MPIPPKTPFAVVPTSLRWLLAVAILGNLAALWTVDWLPLGHLGLAVQSLDLAARYYDAETGYRGWFLLPHLLDPGTLADWLARALPFLNAWTVAKLWLSFYVIGLPLALLALARALGRSPWLALFTIPLTWNALANAGLLDALIALPLLFLALALARTMAAMGGIWRGALLALTLVLLFFAHIAYFALALVSVVFLFIWYRHDLWSLTRLWVLLPTVPLVLQWLWRQLVAAQTTSLANSRPQLTLYLPPRIMLARLYDWTLLFFADHVDYFVAVALLLAWLAMFTIGEVDVAFANRGLLDPKSFERRMFGRRKWTWQRVRRAIADGSLLNGAMDRRKLRWVNVQEWLGAHGLEILTLLWGALYFALPTQFRGVPVAADLLPVPTLLLLTLWPRVDFVEMRRWLAAPVFAVAIAYSLQARAEFRHFNSVEVAGLPEQLADLPHGARFAYVMWARDSRVAYKGALWHLPTAIFASQHGGLMDDNPATQPQAVVRMRKGLSVVDLQGDFWADPALLEVDFVLLRTTVEPEDAQNSPHLEHVWHNRNWWLFRVVHGDRARIRVVTAGGMGGLAAYGDCPRGTVLQGLLADMTLDGVRSVKPLCQDLRQARPANTPADEGARLGGTESEALDMPLQCPRGQYVVALTGRSTQYVTALQVQCAKSPWPNAQFELTPTRIVGAATGKDFDVRCPEGTIGVGVQGRFGDVTDQIGLACADLLTW